MFSCPVLKTRLSSPTPQNASLQKDERPHASVRAGCCVTVWRHMEHVRSSVKQKAKFSFKGWRGRDVIVGETATKPHNSHGRRPPEEKKNGGYQACTLYCTPYCTNDGPTKQSAKGRDRYYGAAKLRVAAAIMLPRVRRMAPPADIQINLPMLVSEGCDTVPHLCPSLEQVKYQNVQVR